MSCLHLERGRDSSVSSEALPPSPCPASFTAALLQLLCISSFVTTCSPDWGRGWGCRWWGWGFWKIFREQYTSYIWCFHRWTNCPLIILSFCHQPKTLGLWRVTWQVSHLLEEKEWQLWLWNIAKSWNSGVKRKLFQKSYAVRAKKEELDVVSSC